jgi:hypothetical protein
LNPDRRPGRAAARATGPPTRPRPGDARTGREGRDRPLPFITGVSIEYRCALPRIRPVGKAGRRTGWCVSKAATLDRYANPRVGDASQAVEGFMRAGRQLFALADPACHRWSQGADLVFSDGVETAEVVLALHDLLWAVSTA